MAEELARFHGHRTQAASQPRRSPWPGSCQGARALPVLATQGTVSLGENEVPASGSTVPPVEGSGHRRPGVLPWTQHRARRFHASPNGVSSRLVRMNARASVCWWPEDGDDDATGKIIRPDLASVLKSQPPWSKSGFGGCSLQSVGDGVIQSARPGAERRQAAIRQHAEHARGADVTSTVCRSVR